jgi:two-component system, probable response regulator PhcQ
MTMSKDPMPHTVLFVDDDTSLLDGLRRTMRHEPFRVLCAESTDRAHAVLESERVDVVISDEHLPGASGSEFLADIRKSYPATFRIMLTGQATLGAAMHAINAGEIFRFLLKPCSHSDLVETINHALAQKQLMDHCRSALRILRRQTSLLNELEKHHPGITRERLPGEATSVFPAMEDAAPETLVDQIEAEIVRARDIIG